MSAVPENREQLETFVQGLIPGASLVAEQLPQAPSIRLLLLDPEYPQHELPPDVALRLMDEPIYWIFCWASGQVMARYILDNPQWVAAKTVVDFGAGSGVVGIAAAMAGAARVICCDNDPVALTVCRENAALNGVSVETTPVFEPGDEVDIILVADVLYDKSNLPLLEFIADKAPSVLLADSRVKNLGMPAFTRLGEYESSTWPDLAESVEFNQVRLYYAGKPAASAVG